MAGPFLLVQTPRAGSKNHRFLVSQNSGLDDAGAGQIVARALQRLGGDRKAVGPDFLAVGRRGVFQAGADRTGDEVLLLGGIDVGRLPDDRRQQILARLEQRLSDMKEVIGGIDWERSSKMLVEEEHLDEWLRGDFTGLPAGKRASRRSWATRLRVPAAVLVAALSAAAVCAQIKGWFGPARTETAPAPVPPAGPPRALTTPEDRFGALLKEWPLKDKRDEALRDLAAIAGIERMTDPTQVLNDRNVAPFLSAAATTPGEFHGFDFFQEGEYGRLRDLTDSGRLTNESIIGIRKCLSDVVNFIHEFQEEVEKVDPSTLVVDKYPYLQTAKDVATKPFKIPRGVPVLPVFSKLDEDVLDKVPQFLDEALDRKVKTKIHWENEKTLDEQLELLKKHKTELREELNQNLDEILCPAAKGSGPPDQAHKGRIQQLKVKFDTLLGQLARAELKPSPGKK